MSQPIVQLPPELVTDPDSEILQFFTFDHLPEKLRAISKPFCELANAIRFGNSLMTALPRSHERTAALRKLLESKDAAVRAQLLKF